MRTTTPKMNTIRSLLATACALTCLASQAATIVVTSRDPAGVGFNDTTPVNPVGGNPGTTLGQQRLNVYRYVADIWEKNLTSDVTITVSAAWESLSCTATGATLGSASAWNMWHDFPGSVPGTWYPQALANKLAGVNLSAGQPDDGTGYGNVDIKTQFNVNLGNPGCLTGSFFYLGLDGKAGSNVNFVETLLHELGHGLGFAALTDTSVGYRIDPTGSSYVSTGGLPSIWEGFMYDNTTQKTWLQMSNDERAASAVNPLKLAWRGANAVAGATLLAKTPVIKVASPGPSGTGMVDYTLASFGPAVPTTVALGSLAVVATQPGETGPGCDKFNAANVAAVSGKVAIMSRGTCGFAVKAKNAQNAGAIGVLLANNAAGPAIGLGGADATITIPTVGISQDAGIALKAAVAAALPYGSRGKPGLVTASWSVDPARIAGADAAGRPLLYTPNPRVAGSSVSHWDVSATPNLLMEPAINADLGTILVAPKDLTVPLLKDIGW
jgi:hypothetical protein